jgi:hypothetical protein
MALRGSVAFDLEPDAVEEDRHQAIVDPMAKLQAQHLIARRKAKRYAQHLPMGPCPGELVRASARRTCYTASIEWRGVALIAGLLLALWLANRVGPAGAGLIPADPHRGSP